MTEEELNRLADKIVDKLLTTFIKDQARWYTSSTYNMDFDHFMNHSKKKPTTTEEELLGELASLMTQLNLHQEKEEYEKCAVIKRRMNVVNKILKRGK